MSIPTHKIECLTKAYKTNCPDCKDNVWYFSCSCGSKVFFDELGWPWNAHRCKGSEIKEAISMIRDFDRYTDDEIYKLIETYKKNYGVKISDEIWELLEYELGKRKYPFKFSEINCSLKINLVTGQIMEINKSINFYKKYNLDKNSIFSTGLLGNLTKSKYDELIVRENPDKENHSKQYKIYLDQKNKSTIIKKGDKILAQVSVYQIPSGSLWTITKYKIV